MMWKSFSEYIRAMFLTVLFIRFAYYGVSALMASFLKKGLIISEAESIRLMTIYLTLANTFIFFGAIFADKVLGIRRSFLLGHFFYMLAFCTIAYISFGAPIFNPKILLLAFILLVIAGTTMNSTPQIIMTRSFQSKDTNLVDITYTYHYFFGNLGTICGKFIFPILLGTSLGLLVGYKIAFSFGSTLALVSVLIIIKNYNKLVVVLDEFELKKYSFKKELVIITYFFSIIFLSWGAFSISLNTLKTIILILFLLGMSYFIVLTILEDNKEQKNKYILAIIICIQMIVFFIYRNQIFITLSIFPLNTMQDFHIFGITIGGEFTIAFNALWNILGAPILVVLLKLLHKIGTDFSIGDKFTVALILTAVSYGIFWYSCIYALNTHAEKISIVWFFMGHAFVAMAELLMMNLVMSKLSQIVPKTKVAAMLGFYYMSMGIGSIFGGFFASQIALNPGVVYSSSDIFYLYKPFFSKLAIIATICSIIFFFTTKIMKKLER